MLRDLLIMALASLLVASLGYGGWSIYKSRTSAPAPVIESAALPEPQAASPQPPHAQPEPPVFQLPLESAPSVALPDAHPQQPGASESAEDAAIKRAMALYERKDFSAAMREVDGIETSAAMMLRGLCYCGMQSNYLCTVELEKAVAAGIDSRDAAKLAEGALALAYYKLDELGKSYAHAKVVMSYGPDDRFSQFFTKLEREYRASKDSHIQESSDHFKVVFDGYEHGSIDRTVLSILEDAYSDVGKRLDYYPAHPVTVVLNTSQEFYDVTRSPSWAGGLYDGKIRIPVRNIENFGQGEIRRILKHEYVHALMHTIVDRAPHWVNEGLAEYLTRSEGPKPLGQVFPLSMLERGFPAGDVRAVAISYNESHEAVTYLVDRYGMYSFMGFLRELGAGKTIDEAFRNAFIISYEEFLRDWGKKTG